MALRIQPTMPPRPLFRRLVREGAAGVVRGQALPGEGSAWMRVSEGWRYPHAVMHIETMAALLEASLVPARPDGDTPYEDTDPVIDQIDFGFIPPQPGTGFSVSRHV